MRSALALVLLLGSAALGFWAWATLQPSLPEGLAGGAARPLPPARTAATQIDPARRQTEVATVLDRPVFSANRRPKGEAGAPTPTATAAVPLPRMTAILVDGNARSAIFDSGDKPTVLREGGHIGVFTIQSIEPQQVTIIGPEGKRVVRTSFAANRPAPAGPPGLPSGLPTGFPQATFPPASAPPVVLPPGFPGLGIPGAPPPGNVR